ncbi:hypothetical protein GH714_026819 [Hevea brasiliensis]|uniref:Uncharacterized protein n=1 Tax=Hevea brasiliensis TaxID=3981 RepID=A0A6A6N735_HEVBR|nr:hypothetical protein GH714_026819 [Hevea brasiliensis]
MNYDEAIRQSIQQLSYQIAVMGSLMMKLIILPILILGGSIPCSFGVEFESLASEKGRFGSQVAGKAKAGKNSYLGFEDVKRNQMMGKLREYENIITTSASKQNVYANFRYNQMIMRRLFQVPISPAGYAPGSQSPPGPGP